MLEFIFGVTRWGVLEWVDMCDIPHAGMGSWVFVCPTLGGGRSDQHLIQQARTYRTATIGFYTREKWQFFCGFRQFGHAPKNNVVEGFCDGSDSSDSVRANLIMIQKFPTGPEFIITCRNLSSQYGSDGGVCCSSLYR
jgi:hypothetical protein